MSSPRNKRRTAPLFAAGCWPTTSAKSAGQWPPRRPGNAAIQRRPLSPTAKSSTTSKAGKRPGFAPETVAGEDDEFWLNRTFQRFAQAVGPDGLDRFPSLAAVLGYLKMCAYCTVLDELRTRRRHQHVSLDLLADSVDTGADLEHSVVDRLTAHELWNAAMRALPDETDRLVFRLSFKYGWKPQEIHEKYGDRFLSVADVYRTKRKLLERLRRDPQLRRFSP